MHRPRPESIALNRIVNSLPRPAKEPAGVNRRPHLSSSGRAPEGSGDTFLRRIVEILPKFSDKRQAVDISQQIQEDVSAYLVTITAMNAAVGIATATSLGLLSAARLLSDVHASRRGPFAWPLVAMSKPNSALTDALTRMEGALRNQR